MTPDPVRSDARRARHLRKLGPDAACALCGVMTPEVLIVAKRTVLEAHHACGRAHDPDLTIPLCRNCHAVQTEGQRMAGVDFSPPSTFLHQLVAALTSLGMF